MINLFNQTDMEDFRINFDKLMRKLQKKAARNHGRSVYLSCGKIADKHDAVHSKFVQGLLASARQWLRSNPMYPQDPSKLATFEVVKSRFYDEKTDAAGFTTGGEWVVEYLFVLKLFDSNLPSSSDWEVPELPPFTASDLEGEDNE